MQIHSVGVVEEVASRWKRGYLRSVTKPSDPVTSRGEVPPNMESISASGRWLLLLKEVVKEVEEPSGPVMAAALTAKLGVEPGLGAALLSGMETLADYATSDLELGAVDAEALAIAVAMKAVRPILEAQLQRRLDALDRDLLGEAVCRRCEKRAQSEGRRGRGWASLSGDLSLQRRYVHCDRCGEGYAPSQLKLGLGESPFTPRLEEVCTMMATTVPHGMAVKLVGQLLGTEVSGRGIQQMVERRAQGLAAQLTDEAIACAPYDGAGLPVEHARPAATVASAPETLYLEMDGVVPMTREELPTSELSDADRRRKRRAKKNRARGGRGKRYRLVGREVKNAVIYSAENCVKESPSRDCITDKRYVSHLGDATQFGALLWVELLRRRIDEAKRVVVLSDGAEWIRTLCAWLPIPVLLILDLFHVKHRIWEVANLLYGEHTPEARRWADAQCDRVEAGRATQVIEALRFLNPRRAQTKEAVRLLADYLSNNLDRMDYPAYRAMGLRVGSGAVESANYHVTGTRLKLQGMRWSEQGAREMAYLRADLFNGEWERRTRALLAA